MRGLAILAMAPALMAAGDAAAIMAKMAERMEAGVEARRQYVYEQRVKSSMIRTNGRMARREDRLYRVLPGPEKTEKKLLQLDGEYHKSKDEVIRYNEASYRKDGAIDLDGDILEDLTKDLVDAKDSRDGIPHSLFPLTKKDLRYYAFTLRETAEVKGRKAHRIEFVPRAKKEVCGKDEDCDWRPWKGEALVDAEEFQPVRIATDMTFKMPWGVRVFLGTNLRQTGFSVTYERVAPGVWFPATYGTEFRLDVLFGYKRVIALNLESRDFRRAEAESSITFETDKPN